MLQNNRVGGWEDLRRKTAATPLLRVSKQSSGKSSQQQAQHESPDRAGIRDMAQAAFASVCFRTQVPSLKCCQLLLVSNNIDNEAPFIDKKRGGRNWYF